ncbi:protease-associated domain-containing protein [Hymenobacter lapidiphilus]|uniref:PA domain-containing protein n=1 Tax=Hymenobacter sp. CCM 8763 TaxID=2303334 RepID=UPI001F5BDE9F|nr:PA domain-containing protein [Hymenobacter sp. CCM 8763]
MKFSTLLLLPALLLPALEAAAQTTTPSSLSLPKSVRRSMDQVRPEAIRAHVAYLADDRLLGRKPGTLGYQMAVDYVVAQLKERGVEPAGENGGFTQRVRLRRATVRPGAAASYQPAAGAAGLPLDAISLLPHPEQPTAQLPATGLVFAGYGISAPAEKYDDYQGLDARGKVVVVLRGAPPAFPSTVAAASQDQTQIVRTAAAHGAVGVLFATLRAAPGGPSRLASSTSVLGADGKVAAARGFVSGPAGVALTGTLSAPACKPCCAPPPPTQPRLCNACAPVDRRRWHCPAHYLPAGNRLTRISIPTTW